MRQRRLDGKGPVDSYNELCKASKKAMPHFEELMRRIVERAGLDPDAEAMHAGKPLPLDGTTNFKRLTIAKLKSKKRCDEKVANEYDHQYEPMP